MRHLNFQTLVTGELISLDGFNRDIPLTRALVGDSSGTLKFPEIQWLFSGYANYTVPGLPVMDNELLRILDLVCPRCKKVFLFPSTEMHGVLRAREILARLDRPWSDRFLDFEGEDRYCFNGKQYLMVNLSDADRLRQNYLEILTGLLSRYSNLYLVPVVNRFLQAQAPNYFGAYPEVVKMERALNLKWLDPGNVDYWADDQGHLSRLAWTILKEGLEAV